MRIEEAKKEIPDMESMYKYLCGDCISKTLVMVADLLIRGEVQPQDLDNYTNGLQQGYEMAFKVFHRGLKLIAKEMTGEAENEKA